MRTAAFILALSCAGCVSAETVPVLHAVCLKMVEYTDTQEKKAAAELSALPKDAELQTMMTDYGKMRAGNRACRAANH